MMPTSVRGLRLRSAAVWGGLPLLAIAIGPDPSRGESRGHARGVVAIGDIATGWIALGGVARSGLAIGGVAFGLVALGGLGLGGLALGGLAVGLLAAGGAAIGGVAFGGLAVGVYALGGAAFGQHVLSAVQRSPEAVEFFKHWLPWLPLPQ